MFHLKSLSIRLCSVFTPVGAQLDCLGAGPPALCFGASLANLGKAVMRAELLRPADVRRLGGDARRCASLQFCPGSFAFGDETEKVAGITRGGQEVEPGEVLRALNAVAQIA
jgi:hypothetical protein